MTPEQTLIICMLNTITDKALMVKVNENLQEGMTWMEVRNIIVKLDRAAHLSDVYRQTTECMLVQCNQSLAEHAENLDTCQHCAISLKPNSIALIAISKAATIQMPVLKRKRPIKIKKPLKKEKIRKRMIQRMTLHHLGSLQIQLK